MSATPKTSPTFAVPLFDRLTLQATCALTLKEVEDSIQRELSRLFNSRVPYHLLPGDDTLDGDGDETGDKKDTAYLLPDRFGIWDFSAFPLDDGDSWTRLEMQLEAACLAYEPRLQAPRVSLITLSPLDQKLVFSLTGEIGLGEQRVMVSFPLSVDWRSEDGALPSKGPGPSPPPSFKNSSNIPSSVS